MGPFARRRGGIEAVLRDLEAEVLRRIVDELRAAIVAEERPAETRRLFPPGYEGDEGAQAEFAALTTDDLVRLKTESLDVVGSTLDRARRKRGAWLFTLTEDEADRWLRVLNDARLTLGTKLDVTEDDYDRPLDPADPVAPDRELYLWLGWLQQGLVETLLG